VKWGPYLGNKKNRTTKPIATPTNKITSGSSIKDMAIQTDIETYIN
jgi:hypothetical protein